MKELFYFSFLIVLFVIFFFFSILHESIYISIFFLISLFLLSSLLFIISGMEFIGFLYLIVYVGAVAVLFLFMVMLFDRTEYVIFNRPTEEDINEKSLSIGIVFVFAYNALVFLFYPMGYNDLGNIFFFIDFDLDTDFYLDEFDYYYLIEECYFDKLYFDPVFFTMYINNIEAIGAVLYDYFFLGVIGAALVLLLGMIGSIFLTQSIDLSLSSSLFYKHQDIKKQLLHRNI